MSRNWPKYGDNPDKYREVKWKERTADTAEPALHIPQQTNGAGAKATLPPDCLECAFGLCCDRGRPVVDGSCFEQRR